MTMKENNEKKTNQSSSYSPNSIGGRIDEMLREKLKNIKPINNEQAPEKNKQQKK
jgi:hypothetical protein